MAIINKGEILHEAQPLEAMNALHGRIWQKVIAKNQLDQMEREYRVISTKLLGGRTVVHVYGQETLATFDPVLPDLEDVYFSVMAGHVTKYQHGKQTDQPANEA